MSVEYKVTWRRAKWLANTWPQRRHFGRWPGAVAWAKTLERDQSKFGAAEITIHQRTCGPWRPTVVEDEGATGVVAMIPGAAHAGLVLGGGDAWLVDDESFDECECLERG